MKPDVSIIPTRAPVPIIARKPLTRREAIYLAVKQHGLCGCGECDKLLDPLTEGVIDEHVLALRLGGTNDLTNRALWRLPCAKAKTKTAGHDSKQGSKLTRRANKHAGRVTRVKRTIRSNPKIPKKVSHA